VENKKLFRNMREADFLGVGSGLADYFGIDVRIVRAILIILSILGIGIIIYFALFFAVKEDPSVERSQGELATDGTKQKTFVFRIFVYVFLVGFAIVVLIPFYWMLLTSIKSFDQIYSEIPPSLWVPFRDMMFKNYLSALDAAPYLTYMKNTVIVAFFATVGTVLTTILAGFAFARLNFKGRDILFAALIATMMIPGEMFVITNYITVSDLGWYSPLGQTQLQAFLALTTPFMTSVFYIFFLRQTFKQIPDELYLAAKVDGTSDFKYLRRIMVPIASPTIITITILNAMGTWSAYIWPNLVTSKDEYRLITNGLRNAYTDFSGQVAYNEQMAAAMIVTFPLLVVFLFLRKYIMRGVSRSGIKG
jgi:multiple sugar transport system permease protein